MKSLLSRSGSAKKMPMPFARTEASTRAAPDRWPPEGRNPQLTLPIHRISVAPNRGAGVAPPE
jgi:hypothetical protein